jgi:hypothetical protein
VTKQLSVGGWRVVDVITTKPLSKVYLVESEANKFRDKMLKKGKAAMVVRSKIGEYAP